MNTLIRIEHSNSYDTYIYSCTICGAETRKSTYIYKNPVKCHECRRKEEALKNQRRQEKKLQEMCDKVRVNTINEIIDYIKSEYPDWEDTCLNEVLRKIGENHGEV